MRSIWRTIDERLGRQLARDIALVLVADGLVGVSFGAIAVSDGFPLWVPIALSVVVFGGASQFMFIGLIAAGGALVPAVLAGLVVNARHLPFGFAVADVLGSTLPRRALGSHLMIDESVAFSLAQRDPARRRAAYWICGAGLFVCWNVGVVIGGVAGTVITDTDAFGLDAAFPAVLLALILPSLRDRRTLTAAVVGVAIALVTTPFVPAGLPVLLALAGVAICRPKATEEVTVQ
ncbi:AzlC family ABC transporter permease [Nocardioidaceae bacterium SCSIO 66511]|nr:AzlC family ABC transporter permease [Nocardioidaceae bacterium SCSIO 66511]